MWIYDKAGASSSLFSVMEALPHWCMAPGWRSIAQMHSGVRYGIFCYKSRLTKTKTSSYHYPQGIFMPPPLDGRGIVCSGCLCVRDLVCPRFSSEHDICGTSG